MLPRSSGAVFFADASSARPAVHFVGCGALRVTVREVNAFGEISAASVCRREVLIAGAVQVLACCFDAAGRGRCLGESFAIRGRGAVHFFVDSAVVAHVRERGARRAVVRSEADGRAGELRGGGCSWSGRKKRLASWSSDRR